MNSKKIGAFIQGKRIDAKITQEELAKKKDDVSSLEFI